MARLGGRFGNSSDPLGNPFGNCQSLAKKGGPGSSQRMTLRFADCTIDAEKMILTRGGVPVAVEPQVFDLIHLLAQNGERVVPRDEIVGAVWHGRIVLEPAISACIASARKAVGDTGKDQAVIRTLARRGLAMAAKVTTDAPASPSDLVPRSNAAPRIRYAKDSAGHAIAYARSGAGAPVVRSSHSLTDIQYEWQAGFERAFLKRIEANHEVLRFDSVGIGQSAGPIVKVDFDQFAEEISIVAKAAGLDRFALYSESGGVHAALRFAAKYPQCVSRLIVVGGYVHGRSRRRGAPDHDPLRAMIAEGWRNPDSGVHLWLFALLLSGGAAGCGAAGCRSDECKLLARDGRAVARCDQRCRQFSAAAQDQMPHPDYSRPKRRCASPV